MASRLQRPNRRTFLRLAAALPAPIVLAACGVPSGAENTPAAGEPAAASTLPSASPAAATALPAASPAAATTPPATLAPVLAATPACGDDDDPTPPQMAGPFFTPNSPERRSLLEPNMAGTRLLLSGYVLNTNCQPAAGALLDFWQADDAGAYDNNGYRLRGHQFADDNGYYALETIVPGLYPGRTRHIHVNVQAPNQRILTTQLYFPDEPANDRDRIYQPELVVVEEPAGEGRAV
jgi:protocatechuate 3,4-dioxygenase beta subunit